MTGRPRPVDRVLIVAIAAAIAIVFAVRADGVQRQMRKSALLKGLVQDIASLETTTLATAPGSSGSDEPASAPAPSGEIAERVSQSRSRSRSRNSGCTCANSQCGDYRLARARATARDG